MTRSSRGRLREPGDPPRGVCRPSEVEGQPALVFWGSDGGVCTPAIHLGARPAPPEPLGADAFLPALTEELIWSPHIGETQLDVEFLMELLDPDELRGEGEPPPRNAGTPQGAPWGQTASPCSKGSTAGGPRATSVAPELR